MLLNYVKTVLPPRYPGPTEEGAVVAAIADIEDLGEQPKFGKPGEVEPRLRMYFTTGEVRDVEGEKQPVVVIKEFAQKWSAWEDAQTGTRKVCAFRQAAEKAMGEELPDLNFDTEELIGKVVTLTLEEQVSQKGNTYYKIAAISKGKGKVAIPTEFVRPSLGVKIPF